MTRWGIAEWYGKDVVAMAPVERKEAAEHALAALQTSLKLAPQPECPFQSARRPGTLCTKAGGVCSIRQYEPAEPAVATDAQPTTMCPNRFLEHRGSASLFSYLSEQLFAVSGGAQVIKEIPFLEKETIDGKSRGPKAGRIDWIIVPTPPALGIVADMPWAAVETQGVYFSGDKIELDVQAYMDDPSAVHYPAGKRRPDYRSSGAKRLAPQLDAKAPVMNRWGRKVVVVVDRAFFDEMGSLVEADSFDNSEVVWLVARYSDKMVLEVDVLKYAELRPSVSALQASKPVNKSDFESALRAAITSNKPGKVFNA